MLDHEITHVRYDGRGKIAWVLIHNKKHSVRKIARWIDDNGHHVYTRKRGKVAIVYSKRHWWSGNPFLTTKRDGIFENNLYHLPRF